MMKRTIMVTIFAMLLAGCASSQTRDGEELASADENSGPKTKRVCETVRTNQTGQRLQRVCRDVVVEES